jgi:hypothetical protein
MISMITVTSTKTKPKMKKIKNDNNGKDSVIIKDCNGSN